MKTGDNNGSGGSSAGNPRWPAGRAFARIFSRYLAETAADLGVCSWCCAEPISDDNSDRCQTCQDIRDSQREDQDDA